MAPRGRSDSENEAQRRAKSRDRAHRVFMRAFTEFMEMSEHRRGSVTIHFTEGRTYRTTEWRMLGNDDEGDDVDQAS